MSRPISTLRTIGAFANKRACSDTLFHVLNEAFDKPMPIEEKAAQLLAGGILQHGYQCGMIWGSTLAAGAQAYRMHGAGPLAETKAIIAGKRIVDSFHALKNEINCLEITHIDKDSTKWEMFNYFVIKGGTIGCFRMSGQYAKIAFQVLSQSLAKDPDEVPSSPVSCASLLAQKAGVSEAHMTMASGLAGGIGLCGGACGALGAALWIMQMKVLQSGATTNDYKSPEGLVLIDKFLKSSDYKFECSEIVGRKFKNIEDHANYVCNGGCNKIIETLAESIV